MRQCFVVLVFLFFTAPVFGQEAGTGIGIFLPESVYAGQAGAIGFEQGLGTEIGVGNGISIPLGIEYLNVGALLPAGTGFEDIDEPWFQADIFSVYLQGKYKLEIGSFFIAARGGLMGSFPVSIQVYEQAVGRSIAADGEVIALDTVQLRQSFGVGWIASAEIGFQINESISIQLEGGYRDVAIGVELSADSYVVTTGASPAVVTGPALNYSADQLKAALRGFTIGIGGSFSF